MDLFSIGVVIVIGWILVAGFFSWYGKTETEKRNRKREERLQEIRKAKSMQKPEETIKKNRTPNDDHVFLEWIDDKERQVYKLVYKGHPVLNAILYYYDRQVGLINSNDLIGCIKTNGLRIDIISPVKGIARFNFVAKEREFRLSSSTEILRLEYSEYAIKQYFKEIQDIKDAKVKRKQAIELLKKLRELARRGVGGEQKNAERMFYEMLDKYGIRESELS